MSMSTSGADADGGQQRETIVLRPRAVRVAAYCSAVVVMAGMIGGAVLITSFQWGGRLVLVLVVVLVFLFCHLGASVKVPSRPVVLEVRNLMRSRPLAWAEVLVVSFQISVPLAHLDLADGRTHPLQAIQRYDGDRAIAAAHQLQRLIRERGEASPL